MKTVITTVLILISIICSGQDQKDTNKEFFTPKQTAQLEEVVKELSTKLAGIQNNQALFSSEEMNVLKEALLKVQTTVNSEQLLATFQELNDSSKDVKITYKVVYDDGAITSNIKSLDGVDLSGLVSALKEVAIKLHESPKLKELAKNLKELESKYSDKKE